MAEDRPPAGGKPGTTPPEAATPSGGDPSMEDILASIRRILNEEDGAPSPEAAEQPEEPLTLSEDMLVGLPAAPPEQPLSLPAPAAPAAQEDVSVTSPPPSAQPGPGASRGDEGLIGPAAAAAATASLGHLLRAVASERGATVTRGGLSIEDLVREEVRPLLKEWLDQHLPPLVERLVRAEIERVVGRALS